MLFTQEYLNSVYALWWSKFLHSSDSMNHYRVGTCNIAAVHSNATIGSKRHSSLRKQSEPISTGRYAAREDGVWMSAVERGGTTCAARQKRESLGQSGVFVHIPRGRRGFPCSPSLWRTLTTLNTQEQINDAMSSNPEGSRLHAKKKKKRTKSWLCRHPVNPVMNPHSAKSC